MGWGMDSLAARWPNDRTGKDTQQKRATSHFSNEVGGLGEKPSRVRWPQGLQVGPLVLSSGRGQSWAPPRV